jgi:uncharacterized damage-inducible protein DinB
LPTFIANLIVLNKSLLKQFDKLEIQRANLLKLISSLSGEQLNAHPEGKWSIAQILSHIIASEHLSVRYINKKILGINESPPTGLKEEAVMILLAVSQRFPFRFRAPKVVVENTTPYQSVEQLKDAWEKGRMEMLEILSRFQEDQLKRKVYKHPIAGMLNIRQAVQFFHEHITHHTPQIKKLLSRN